MREKQKFQWKHLNIGVCYYPEHWDRSLWREDLKRMKENGIHTVRIAEFAWGIFEPEKGVYSYELFDDFLKVAEEEDMKVIFGTPTAIPPVWLTEKYPEVLNCRKDGVLFRHGMRRHFNYNSPKLHELVTDALEHIAAHYAKHPCIVGWQIDNEINCEINEFYSESDTIAFRKFLQEKYKNLDQLNHAWGTVFWDQTYTDWNQVYVPRTTINDWTNPHQMLDYTRFVSESAIGFCRLQSEILRKYVKPGDFITTNGMFRNLDNHKMEDECLDVYTYDCYPNFAYSMREDPKHNTTLNDRRWSKNLTEVRSICPHFGIMEMQSGANGWNTQVDTPAPKPGQISLWAMMSIMHGADYISFFRWRTVLFGTEMYWHGILDYDNCDNRKLKEIQALSKRVQAIDDVAGADYVAPFGLIRDYDNIFDAQQDIWHGRVADTSEMEIFVASQVNHVPMDVVYMRDCTDVEDLKKYPVLIYPHPEIVTEKAAAILEEYVRQGGKLVLGARTGQKDVNGHCVMKRMPGLMAPLTQSAVKEFTLVGPADDAVSADWNGVKIDTGAFNDILEAVGPDAKVLATYENHFYAGEAALVETKAGEGTVLHFGGVFSRENMKAFFEYLGIMEPFAQIVKVPGECEIAVRRKDDTDYLFVLNFSDKEQTISLEKAVTDMDTKEVVEGNVVLPAYGTKVYQV